MDVNEVLGIRFFHPLCHRPRSCESQYGCQVNVVLGIVNILLDIRYFFTHRVLVLILLRDQQLVNMIDNILLGLGIFSPIVSSSPFFLETYS